MLIKDFYIVESFTFSKEIANATILLNSEHDVYKGHFPGQPVVPGVIQIQILRELTEQALKSKLLISELTRAKYLNMIVPGNSTLLVELAFKTTEEGYRINGIIKNNETVFSKVKMKVQPKL